MTTQLRAAAALAALALSTPALAQQHAQTTQAGQAGPKVGIGVGLTTSSVSASGARAGAGTPDVGTLFFVPINATPVLRIEPFIGWARSDVDPLPAGFGGANQFAPGVGTASEFTLGVGGFYVAPLAPQVQLYAGGRLASQWQSLTIGGDKSSRRNTMLALAAGGEYLPVPRVAFGGELQLAYIWYGDYDLTLGGASASGGGGTGSATQATLFARFYFF